MKKTMGKILYLCADTGIPYWGSKGGSIHMREFVMNLRNQGYDITVVAREADARGGGSNSVQYYGLPSRSELSGKDESAESTGTGRPSGETGATENLENLESFLSELHSREQFDLVYERYSLFNLAGLRFAGANGLPLVVEVNAPLINEAIEYRGLESEDTARSAERRLFSGADHIICVSDEVSAYVKSVSQDTALSVVPNGVSVERFTDMDRGNVGRLPVERFDKEDFVIGFVGSLKPWHGVELLINSFAGLPKNGVKNRLLVVGGKRKQKSELKHLCRELGIKKRVIFTGAVEHDIIPALLEMTDVLAAPYPDLGDFYFSALKIFEYMAAGKAIVASSIGQIEKILINEQTALLIPPGDSEALRDALLRLKKDPVLRRELGNRARAEAVSKHTWKSRLQEVSGVFQELLAGARTELEKS